MTIHFNTNYKMKTNNNYSLYEKEYYCQSLWHFVCH